MSLLLLFSGTTTGPISGDLAVTEGNDTLAATATIEIQATVAATEADDVPSAAGTVEITASAAITEADDTVAATATLEIAANVAVTEADDVPSLAGTVEITASLAVTEADDTLASTSTLEILATAVITEADDTLSATAQMPVFFPRRGGTDERQEIWRQEREWEHDLRRIIDQAWLIAHGLIDPVTLEPIPPPDFDGLTSAIEMLHQTLEQKNIDAFMADTARRQEEEAIAVLLLAA